LTIAIDDRTWLLVLTGAGISKESGIPTFRDMGGLWKSVRFEDVASPTAFASAPDVVWSFYGERRRHVSSCSPNAGHRALCELEARLGDRFLLATQNVDGLHEAAGSARMVELHGCLFRTRCASCSRPPFRDETVYEAGTFVCERCGGHLRPDVVWFGEPLPSGALARIDRFIEDGSRERLVFVAVGTSGAVYPAAGLVDMARDRGAETVLVNADPAENGHRFHRFIQGSSGEVLATLFAP
jgi:NAD-dependent deacetylase